MCGRGTRSWVQFFMLVECTNYPVLVVADTISASWGLCSQGESKGLTPRLGVECTPRFGPHGEPKSWKKGSSNRINLQFSRCPGAIYEKLFTLRMMESKLPMPHPGFTYCCLTLGLHIVDLIVCIKCSIFSERNVKKVQPSSWEPFHSSHNPLMCENSAYKCKLWPFQIKPGS